MPHRFSKLGLRIASYRILLLGQLLGTAAVLGWVPSNTIKLVLIIAIWMVGIARMSAVELRAMVGINLLFVAMDWGAVSTGTFRFNHPDFLGLPIYEYLVWGFYTLHAIHLLDGKPPRSPLMLVVALSAIFAIPFLTIADPLILALTAALALAAAIAFYHDPLDFVYVGYMAAVGAVVEYIGVGTGQWEYPNAPYGGVPLWSAVMWGGIGLFTRRLLQPLIYPRAGQAESLATASRF